MSVGGPVDAPNDGIGTPGEHSDGGFGGRFGGGVGEGSDGRSGGRSGRGPFAPAPGGVSGPENVAFRWWPSRSLGIAHSPWYYSGAGDSSSALKASCADSADLASTPCSSNDADPQNESDSTQETFGRRSARTQSSSTARVWSGYPQTCCPHSSFAQVLAAGVWRACSETCACYLAFYLDDEAK